MPNPPAPRNPDFIARHATLGFHTPICRHRWLSTVLVLPVLAVLSACGEQQQAPPVDAPPPSVVAIKAESKPVEQQAQFVGRVVAVNKVELRARVQGFLKERRFTEGQTVEVGDVLFVIEPDQYESIVEQRQADVAKAIADEENAGAQLKRGEELLKSKNIPASQVDELRAAESIAKASILQAKAALAAAELDLSYTKVTAPVAGRIGLAKFTMGNLVGPSSGTLATLVSHDPIHVRFPLTQRELLEAKRKVQEKGGSPKDVVVGARLPDGSTYERKGRLDFVDVTTDAGTDTVTLRAEFPNPDRILVDGQYVGVTVQASESKSEIVVPQSALQVDQQGVFVMIVDADKKAQVRRIRMGQNQGSAVAVTSGLSEGDLVITLGIQKIRPGQVVSVAPQQKPGGSAAP
jgi:membrane fusion protein (multidrug efflux system)